MSKVKKLLCQASRGAPTSARNAMEGSRLEREMEFRVVVLRLYRRLASLFGYTHVGYQVIKRLYKRGTLLRTGRFRAGSNFVVPTLGIKLWTNIDRPARSPWIIHLELDEVKLTADDLKESLCEYQQNAPATLSLYIICHLIFVQSHSPSRLQHSSRCTA